jgi:hypothetical protein
MTLYKGQKSVRGGIQDFLCPFTDMYITQGSNGAYSHRGIMANDVRGASAGVRYPYYAPCDVKCVRTYASVGQAMWQSLNKVRFANGRIYYATFMTVHDNSFNAKVGQVVRQGEQLGNMGNKGNATGVHCHIQVSQSNDTSWYKNSYGIYKFNHEYDLDDCYFVDNTNIIYGMGGNWRTTGAVPVSNVSGKEVVDQILHVGSKVKFSGVFKVDILKRGTNLFGNTKLTGVSFNDYYNLKAKDYHWIPLDDFTEVDQYGSSAGQDQVAVGGASYVLNKNVYEVKDIDSKTNSALLVLNGHKVWIYCTFLYEV